ncbi:hypothetical protein BCR42DRAFT_438502 [Absidia repens]|uniref:Uncharacterized protein n=1 Tax=Absidia repens TaxID=90262 RepID=A0A1X2IF29_9FUNG|nr:hypothetical protein BCR42DRAFT_438502 [Absidia repens]
MASLSLLDKALRAAERLLSANANRSYKNMVSLYSTMLLGDMVAQSEQYSNEYSSSASQEPYCFEKVIDLVTHHFPFSARIQSMPTHMMLEEIRDIAWEIEACVIETITYMVNDLEVNPYTIRCYVDLPAVMRLRAQKYFDDQLIDLGVPINHVSVRPFMKGLLAHRWELFATSLESSSSPLSSIF